MNKVKRSIETVNRFFFTIISFPILFQKQQEKLNLSFWLDLFLE